MGQKVHPTGFRLGVIKKHRASWYAKGKSFKENLIEDLIYSTNGKGMYEITDDINNWVSKKNITQGQLNLFIQHTSASLIIMENASPDVLEDINRFFLKLVPEDSSLYSH